MSLINQLKLFANYNQLMNQRFYDASAQLNQQQLNTDQGAFFGSVLGTLNHILVGDMIWLKRFATRTREGHSSYRIEKDEKICSLRSE